MRRSVWRKRSRKTLATWVCVVCAWVALTWTAPVRAEDWPTYRHDNRRSGVTSEDLVFPLKPHDVWVHKASQIAQPVSLDEPAQQDFWNGHPNLVPKQTHDRAFHVAVVQDRAYVGSYANDKIYCLDITTGAVRWSFFTDGPVRMAPTVDSGRVYAGSDDGWVYCLGAMNGSLIWKYRASGKDERLFAHGRMASRWPVRTGVAIEGEIAYFCSGVFPEEGVYMCGVNAATGADTGTGLWKRSVPFVAQGYVLATASQLFFPGARNCPEVYTRATGDHVGTFPGKGGTFALIVGNDLAYGPNLEGTVDEYPQNAGTRIATFNGLQMVATATHSYLLQPSSISAVQRPSGTAVWQKQVSYPHCLILAGQTLFAGGEDQVAAFRASDGEMIWSADVEGRAYGLAVANKRLFVSTDRGAIYCFADATVVFSPARASAWIYY